MRNFDELYREYGQSVYRAALRYTGRPEIAEEVVAEAFLALYEQGPHYDTLSLPAWLFTVAKRRAIDYWRRQVHEEALDEGAAERHATPERGIDIMELIRGSESLNATHRTCLILRYVHGMTREEIAVRTGLEATQVKGLLQYALKLLRNEIGKGATFPRS